MKKKFVFNPFTCNFDIINVELGPIPGSGVLGPSSSTDKAISRWQGTDGTHVQDSKAIVQDGGAILAQGYITRNRVTDAVTVSAEQTWMAPDLIVDNTATIVVDLGGTILIEG